MYHFMSNINRRTEKIQCSFNDVDSAVYACAKSMGVSKINIHLARIFYGNAEFWGDLSGLRKFFMAKTA
jgi:hypothetical protein